MSLKDSLTNEVLTKRFPNPFTLVNYTISLARELIEKEDEPEENPASEVLDMIVTKIENSEEVPK